MRWNPHGLPVSCGLPGCDECAADQADVKPNPHGRRVRLYVAGPDGNRVCADKTGSEATEPVENNDARCPLMIVTQVECEFGWHEIARTPLALYPAKPAASAG